MVSIKSALFGKLAVEAKFITEEQLNECLDKQKEIETLGEKPPRLGEILEEKSYLTRQQINAILEAMHSVKKGMFGEIAISLHFITLEQLQTALDIQRLLKTPSDSVSLFGNALIVYRNFLKIVKETSKIPKIGELLTALGYLRPHQVEVVLREQNKKILPCPHCKANLNIVPFRLNSKIRCGGCQAILFYQESKTGEIELVVPHEEELVQPSEEKPAPPPPSTPQKVPPRKTNLVGSYKILKKLGQDATGIVYMAEDILKRKPVALKIFSSSCSEDATFSQSLLKNSQKAIKLEHQNIKKIIAVGTFDSRYYVATEYLEGESIYNILTKQKKVPALNAIRIAIKVANALKYANSFGLLHLDIRPSNILLLNSGEVKLLNLGLPNKSIENIVAISRSGQLAPFYLAPELVTEDRPVDLRADIYGIGSTLYHMISGRPPFEGQSPLEILVRLTEETIPPLNVYKPSVPEIVNTVVEKAIQAEPQDRYNDYDSFIQDLQKAEVELSKSEVVTIQAPQPKKTVISPIAEIPIPVKEEVVQTTTKAKVKKVFSTSLTPFIGPIILIGIIVAIVFLVQSGLTTPKWKESYDKCVEIQNNNPNSYPTLIEQWNDFNKKYPDSPKQTEVKDRIEGLKREMQSKRNSIKNDFTNKSDALIKDLNFVEAYLLWDSKFKHELIKKNLYIEEEMKMEIDAIVKTEKEKIDNKILKIISNTEMRALNIANDRTRKTEERYDEAITLVVNLMEKLKVHHFNDKLNSILDRLKKEKQDALKVIHTPDVLEKQNKEKYERCVKEFENYCNVYKFDSALQLIESTWIQLSSDEYRDKLSLYKNNVIIYKRFFESMLSRINSLLNQYKSNPENDIRPEIEIQTDLFVKVDEISRDSVTFVTKEKTKLVRTWPQLSYEIVLNLSLINAEYNSAQDFYDIAFFAFKKDLLFEAEKYFNIAREKGIELPISSFITTINEKIAQKGENLLNEIQKDSTSNIISLIKLSELKTKFSNRKFYDDNRKIIEQLIKDAIIKSTDSQGDAIYYTFEGLNKIPEELTHRNVNLENETLSLRKNDSKLSYSAENGITSANFMFRLENLNSIFTVSGETNNLEFKLSILFEKDKYLIKYAKNPKTGEGDTVIKNLYCNLNPATWSFFSVKQNNKNAYIYVNGEIIHEEDFLPLEESPINFTIQFKQQTRDQTAEMKIDNMLFVKKK